MKAKLISGLAILLVSTFLIIPKALSESIEVEDIGPYSDEAEVMREAPPTIGDEVKEMKQKMDSDGDGVPDSKDLCPTPRATGVYDIGEPFSLEELVFMVVLHGETMVLETENVPVPEGGNQKCKLSATRITKCRFKGVPEIGVHATPLDGTRHLFEAFYVVDEDGCSATP